MASNATLAVWGVATVEDVIRLALRSSNALNVVATPDGTG
jgi:hypothetical protein